MAMRCPLCGKTANTRSSFYVSEKTKEAYYQCHNIDCSCTFKTIESLASIIRRPEDKKDAGEPVVTAPLPCHLNRYGDGLKLPDRHRC